MALVINGERHAMRLTLGALAELEESLAEPSLVALVERFETNRYSARDVLALLAAGLRGGQCKIAEGDLHHAEIEGGPMAAARAGAELLARAFILPEQ